MDMKSRDGSASVVIGVGFVLLGVLFLLNQFFNLNFLGDLWPLFIVFVGLLFLGGAFAGGGGGSQMAIPGSMITMTGLIMLVMNATGRWEAWAYAWALIWPTAFGIGLVISGTRRDRPGTTRTGWGMVRAGVLIFVLAGAFFELLIGLGGREGGQFLWPILLIGIGVYFLVRRGGISLRYRPETETENDAEDAQEVIDQEPTEVSESDT